MSDDLRQFETWLAPLLARMKPAQRSRIARRVAMDLRRSQQRRITAQQSPEGAPYAPRRKQPKRGKRGRIKRRAAMFRKLRTAAHLRTRGDGHAATVEFTGRVARLARIHQYGLRDAPAPGQQQVQYPSRRLLGFTAEDRIRVGELLLQYLRGSGG